MAQPLEDVYCTLLMSDSYLPGAAVLAHSLRDAGTTKKLAVLVTLETLSADTLAQLKVLYDYLIPVERVRNANSANLYLMGRPDLAFAFTKIALWRQTQFRKVVYLDADVVALRALDELFNIDAPFAAAPDIGWPDAFNSGVMVITPNMGEYWALQTMAATGDSFDGADQGLLNQYFEHRPWQRLKFTYNCTPNAEYQWEPAYRYYKRDIGAVHFIGKDKPWSGSRKSGSGVYGELLARWWAVHDRHLRKPEAASQSEKQQLEQATGKAQSNQSATSRSAQTELGAHTTPTIEEAKNVDQGLAEPTRTVQQRQFSAPDMEWDATRSEPPTQSRPEAANFPSQTYTFSESRSLYKAPRAYPEPPRDLWYKLPENKPKPAETPKPIFPWEKEPDRPRATRVFAEDLPSEPTPSAVLSPTHPFSTVHYDYEDELEAGPGDAGVGVTSPGNVSSPKSADEQWQTFQESNRNAWDTVPGIDNYVRAIMDSHGRRGKTQILQQSTGTEDIASPLLERRNRRESLILTDFPSAVERPSLPVTPAPLRRPSFWGEERNEAGQLPVAEGVPDQTEWVCPHCGFSSVNASDFHRRRESLASASTVVATPLPSAVSAILPKASPTKVELPAELKTAPSKDERATLPKPSSTEDSARAATPRIPTILHPRRGLSASGVPLASLTSPELCAHHTHSPGPSASLSSASANPSEKLDQLRRSSLVEFEHLKNDEHPNPPLRALPEHSVVTEYDTVTSNIPRSGSTSPPGVDSVDGASERKIARSPAPAASMGTASAVHHSLGRVARESFAEDQPEEGQTGDEPVSSAEQSSPSKPADRSSSTGQNTRLFAAGGFTSQPHTFDHSSGGDNNSSQFSSEVSNTYSQDFSSSTSQHSTSTHGSAAQQHSGSTGSQVKAGNTTFTLPDFGDSSSSQATAGKDEILSPTQPGGEEDARKGPGLF
ncbi:glycosyltransferase family 8 protein [Cucurbitaria berberidis CBS 394.84]|uniref:glycogenin glucosyltransferase n=1 Tax=Cucurbitaria berberidis CBS 394.84 TaxID=1168544 RepID=A0A9P4GCL6_9PLEO|nr:glycosyltransferase family 8 protein [Cucurbitaria berberidis CBS 394.84]KAF1843120.1 glycosyltransferase family 8 protein [Cucurbitaria berberidis CBS 394.84]